MLVNDKEYFIQLNEKNYHCALDVTMDYVGGKWKTVVLWYLKKDKKRYGELRKLIPDITERMLSIQLKQLEEDGLIKREVFTEKPPLKVEYSLTDFGKSLIPVLDAIALWGRTLATEKGQFIEK
jgi:DNA-binding HxlR family transcriptional regulator